MPPIQQHVNELTRCASAISAALKGRDEAMIRFAAAVDFGGDQVAAMEAVSDSVEFLARAIAEAGPHAIAFLQELEAKKKLQNSTLEPLA